MNSAFYTSNHNQMLRQEKHLPGFLTGHGFRVFLSILALALLVLYVVRLSTVSIKGYDISALQKEVKTLQEEQAKLQFEIAKNGSMQNIQSRLKSIQFVPVENPEFASLEAPIIAQR